MGTLGVDVEVDLLTLGNVRWRNIQQLSSVITIVGPQAVLGIRTFDAPVIFVVADADSEFKGIPIHWIAVTTWQVVTIEETDVSGHKIRD